MGGKPQWGFVIVMIAKNNREIEKKKETKDL